MMKGSRKANLLVLGLTFLTSLALIGSTMGTLSWYAYSTHATLSYTGTSIRKSVLLNVGIYDPSGWIKEATITKHHLKRDNVNDIVWTTSSTGLSEEVIQDYLEDSDFAVNELSPVTSNERAIDATSTFNLYESPEYGKTAINDGADDSAYVKIPFAFKIVNNDDVLVPNQQIWLTDVDVQASGGKHLEEAVRVFVDNQTANTKFLIKPYQAPSTPSNVLTGATKVGGILDLNGDEIYDYNIENNDKEFIYGHYAETPVPTYSEPVGDDWDENFNETPYSGYSTFLAKHSKSARTLDKSSITFLEAQYYTFNGVKPDVSGDGTYSGGKPIATIPATGTLIGRTDLTIYLEGWDHAIVNAAAGCKFNLGLTFEINKI